MFWCITREDIKKAGCVMGLFAIVVVAISVSVSFRAAGLERAAAEHNAAPAAKHEWGLSFQVKNAPPVPNLEAKDLAPYNSFYISPRPEKKLYLTFDAGYENGNTAAILDALMKHKAPGAFFVVEPFIKENPDLINRMVSEGHIVGNHTHHHPNLTTKSRADFEQELRDVEKAFADLTGKQLSPYFRPPEGKFSNENLEWANAMGYRTFFWSIAYRDWKTDAQPSHDSAIQKIIGRTHDGAIVLLHTTSKTNGEILDSLLTRWEEMGFTFASIADFEEFCK